MASETRKITFDTAAIFTARIISLLLGLVRLKYMAIYLGVGTFGVYTFATYFAAMFGLLFDLGLVQIVTRDIAADRTRTHEYVLNALLLKGLLFIGTSIIITSVAMLSRFDNLTNLAIGFSMLITGIELIDPCFHWDLPGSQKNAACFNHNHRDRFFHFCRRNCSADVRLWPARAPRRKCDSVHADSCNFLFCLPSLVWYHDGETQSESMGILT